MTPAEEDAIVAKVMGEVMPITDCIRLAIRAAVAQERECCAKVCEEQEASGNVDDLSYEIATVECAAAIRRGE